MTKQEIMLYVAATVATLAETDGGPESSLYLALGGDIQKWNGIKGILTSSGLIEVDRSYWVKLTDAGRDLAAKIAAAQAAAKPESPSGVAPG